MIYCLPVGDFGHYAKMDGTALLLAGIYRERLIMWGNIGNTQCCGSAEVYGIYNVSADFLEWLLKSTKAGVILFQYYSWNGNETINQGVHILNKSLKGAWVEKLNLPNNTYMLVVHVDDESSFRCWLNGREEE